MSATLLAPRPYLAVQQATVDPDGSRAFFVRLHTRVNGTIIKKLPAGENRLALLPLLWDAPARLPLSYRHYRLAWGVGAGQHPTTYTLRHDARGEGVTNDSLLGPDYLALWGEDGGPDFVDHTGAPVSADLVDLVGVYPTLNLSNEQSAQLGLAGSSR